ncbi:MAG: hypothetical protein V3T19_12330 [Acidiferrobacterales bacterium]|jgi:hypothetical protein
MSIGSFDRGASVEEIVIAMNGDGAVILRECVIQIALGLSF